MSPSRCGILALLLLAAPAWSVELTVYTARNEQLIKPVFDRYTQETGTTVRFLTDKEGPLLARLQAEGKRTPADLLVTVDAGNLWQAAEAGLLAAVESPTLDANIPAHLCRAGRAGLEGQAVPAHLAEGLQPVAGRRLHRRAGRGARRGDRARLGREPRCRALRQRR